MHTLSVGLKSSDYCNCTTSINTHRMSTKYNCHCVLVIMLPRENADHLATAYNRTSRTQLNILPKAEVLCIARIHTQSYILAYNPATYSTLYNIHVEMFMECTKCEVMLAFLLISTHSRNILPGVAHCH